MNKLLVIVYVPILEQHFDVFIPINKKINDILKLLSKTIYQLSNETFEVSGNLNLINKKTGNYYDLNIVVIDTDIKNGTELILI
ncbi:MAG: hypothetical protein RR404_02400 [Bacilli bacterium]